MQIFLPPTNKTNKSGGLNFPLPFPEMGCGAEDPPLRTQWNLDRILQLQEKAFAGQKEWGQNTEGGGVWNPTEPRGHKARLPDSSWECRGGCTQDVIFVKWDFNGMNGEDDLSEGLWVTLNDGSPDGTTVSPRHRRPGLIQYPSRTLTACPAVVWTMYELG